MMTDDMEALIREMLETRVKIRRAVDEITKWSDSEAKKGNPRSFEAAPKWGEYLDICKVWDALLVRFDGIALKTVAPCKVCGKLLPLPKWPVIDGSLQCLEHHPEIQKP